MADEPRRSGRATKGQHKALDEAETAPKNKKVAQSKKTKKAAEVEEEDAADDEEEKIRCACGDNTDGPSTHYIACEACEYWQHNVCMGIPVEEKLIPELYFCEQCRPEEHKELLEALERGEPICKERQRAAKAKKKAPKRGRKSMNRSRNSEVKQETLDAAQDADEQAAEDTPAQENGIKRKFSEDVQDGANEDEKPPSKPSRADKRRKSTKEASQDPETAVVAMSKLPDDRQKVAKTIAGGLKTGINAKVKAGTFRVPDGETVDSLSEHFATLIEYELYQNHGPKSGKTLTETYRTQFLAILANVKKNPALCDRIIKKTLSPAELAIMATSDMASEELQREREKMKEEADKQAVMIRDDDKPRVRRTHKGDEYVESATAQQESVFTSKPVRRRESEIDGEAAGSPTILSPVNTSRPEPDQRRSSSNFDINNVWAKTAASPDNDTPGDGSFSPPQPSISASATPAPKTTTADPEIDRLLADDDDNYTPAEATTIWRGTLNQPQVASLTVSARFVAGNDFSQFTPWTSFLPTQFDIEGRLDHAKADDYLCGLQWSSRSDVSVLALSPADGNHEAFNTIFEYFSKRDKYAVGAKKHGCSELVKDLYLTPVEIGRAAPPHIDLLDYNTLTFPAKERLLLATFVVNKPATWDEATAAAGQQQVQHGLPPNPYAAQPQFSYSAEAAAILGRFVDSPVARSILAATAGEVQLHEAKNMKSVFERNEKASESMEVFAQALGAGQAA